MLAVPVAAVAAAPALVMAPLEPMMTVEVRVPLVAAVAIVMGRGGAGDGEARGDQRAHERRQAAGRKRACACP
jgi:hypothetical protein